jgi:ATP adenylyltransferase/5',5'''-P-1,P-4-tetraphosphate phosphorylase II
MKTELKKVRTIRFEEYTLALSDEDRRAVQKVLCAIEGKPTGEVVFSISQGTVGASLQVRRVDVEK